MRRGKAAVGIIFISLLLGIPTVYFGSRTGSAQTPSPDLKKGRPHRPIIDFDGDGKSDIAVYSLKKKTLRIKDGPDLATPPRYEFPFPVCGDFSGDGKTDRAYFDRGYWRIVNHILTTTGNKGDLPVPGDYDGDGRTDIAAWRPTDGTWSFRGDLVLRWGGPEDVPAPMDYDGDGKTDVAVWRPAEGTWYIQYSAGNAANIQCGAKGDIPVPQDYDGDGKADAAVWRPTNGNWYMSNASGEITSLTWGTTGDIPVPGDYDGDGRSDPAVWRAGEGQWYIKDQPAVIFGQSGDVPMAWNVWILWARKLLPEEDRPEAPPAKKDPST